MKKNLTKIVNNLKSKLSKVILGVTLAGYTVMWNTTTAFASQASAPSGNTTGVSQIDFGIGQLIGLISGGVSGYGVVQLYREGLEFFSAMKERDTGTMKTAGMGMLSAFGTASISAVVTYLGFTW